MRGISDSGNLIGSQPDAFSEPNHLPPGFLQIPWEAIQVSLICLFARDRGANHVIHFVSIISHLFPNYALSSAFSPPPIFLTTTFGHWGKRSPGKYHPINSIFFQEWGGVMQQNWEQTKVQPRRRPTAPPPNGEIRAQNLSSTFSHSPVSSNDLQVEGV